MMDGSNNSNKKKKRKSKDKKRHASSGQSPLPKVKGNRAIVPWEERDDHTLVQLERNEVVLFMGHAVLEVLEGIVSVDGKLLEAGSPCTKLSTAGRNGLAISLRAQPGVPQVPLLPRGTVRFSLQAPQCSAASGGAGVGQTAATAAAGADAAAGAEAATHLPFTLHDPCAAGAPAALAIPPDWEQALQTVCDAAEASSSGAVRPPVVAICGAKNMGKSSFGRVLVNRLLNYSGAVMYLDTDCGQPEFTPPSMVSLVRVEAPVLGPPCTHMRTPVAAHFLGDTSPQGDPELYCASVRALCRWYCNHGAQPSTGLWPPLVVNTHGWVKGLGLDVLAEVLSEVQPSHVLQFTSPSQPNKNLPPGLFWVRDPSTTPPCIILPLAQAPPAQALNPASPAVAEAEAGAGAVAGAGTVAGAAAWSWSFQQRLLKNADVRALQWHSWAKEVAGQDGAWSCYEGTELWQDASNLAAQRPLCVSLDDVTIRFVYEQDVPASQIGYVLNGAVVGLAVAGTQEGRANDRACGTVQGLHSQPLPCLGLGLVRAVDMEARLLYVLTPLARDEEMLQQVDTLLVGRSDLPPSLLQASESVISPYMALFSLSAEGTASGGAKSRTNLQRNRLNK